MGLSGEDVRAEEREKEREGINIKGGRRKWKKGDK